MNVPFFSFHLPSLVPFCVNSCFTFDILGIHWIIFRIKTLINCLEWMWTSTWGRTVANVKIGLTLALSSMHCSTTSTPLVLRALPDCILLSLVLSCFVSSFFHFLKHCSPACLLNLIAILSHFTGVSVKCAPDVAHGGWWRENAYEKHGWKMQIKKRGWQNAEGKCEWQCANKIIRRENELQSWFFSWWQSIFSIVVQEEVKYPSSEFDDHSKNTIVSSNFSAHKKPNRRINYYQQKEVWYGLRLKLSSAQNSHAQLGIDMYLNISDRH